MAKFFIDRPIFAWVIAIILMLAGVASVFTLPVAQYPTIAPPSIQISATYPGASAKTVEDTVTQVIEQQMSGLDHLLYLSSTSDDSGTATITLTFAAGTNPDIAQVQVQNKLQLATPILPQVVQQLGIKVTKSSSSFLLVLAFVSQDGSMSKYDLANYVASNIQDPISRIDGVGTVTLFGSQYAMRIWLDPNRLNNFGLTPVDVTNAIAAQNVQIALDAVKSASQPHHFLAVTKDGRSAIAATTGNNDCHIILRGGTAGTNYDAESVEAVCAQALRSGVRPAVMIDASHANSSKKPENQPLVLEDVGTQLAHGDERIVGVMIESNLVAGRQDLIPGKPLTYGQSITDGCIGWDTTLDVLEGLAEAVAQRRVANNQQVA